MARCNVLQNLCHWDQVHLNPTNTTASSLISGILEYFDDSLSLKERGLLPLIVDRLGNTVSTIADTKSHQARVARAAKASQPDVAEETSLPVNPPAKRRKRSHKAAARRSTPELVGRATSVRESPAPPSPPDVAASAALSLLLPPLAGPSSSSSLSPYIQPAPSSPDKSGGQPSFSLASSDRIHSFLSPSGEMTQLTGQREQVSDQWNVSDPQGSLGLTGMFSFGLSPSPQLNTWQPAPVPVPAPFPLSLAPPTAAPDAATWAQFLEFQKLQAAGTSTHSL